MEENRVPWVSSSRTHKSTSTHTHTHGYTLAHTHIHTQTHTPAHIVDWVVLKAAARPELGIQMFLGSVTVKGMEKRHDWAEGKLNSVYLWHNPVNPAESTSENTVHQSHPVPGLTPSRSFQIQAAAGGAWHRRGGTLQMEAACWPHASTRLGINSSLEEEYGGISLCRRDR